MGLSSDANPMSESNKLSRPMWNHDDLSMASWLDDMFKYLAVKDPNFQSWCSEGYILNRTTTVVPTQFHGVALREDWVEPGSLEEPLPPEIYVDRAVPSGVDALNPSEMTVSLRACRRVDEALQQEILAGMASSTEQKEWEALSGKSGLKLIPLLQAKRDEASDARDLAVESKLHELVQKGLSQPSVSAFTELRDEFQSWNDTASRTLNERLIQASDAN